MTTLHCVGLPWTETTSEYLTCAYTQKLVKFGQMMADSPYRVIIYSGQENEATCDEHVPILDPGQRERWFGAHDQNSTWGHITWDPASEPWTVYNLRAKDAILARAEPHDLVLLIAGQAQMSLATALSGLIACEPFVGYYGIATDFCAFESQAWRHHVYGNKHIQDGRWYDTVIPNYFDADDFHLAAGKKDDYLLFVGRITARKGPTVAAEVAAAAGRRLLVAGPGANEVRKLPGGGCNIYADGCMVGGKHVEYVGPVGVEERAELMSRAAALLAPTLYIEPFGGVAVEAMLSGTPVVASDWGAFTETVKTGLTGFRFTTLSEGVKAVENAALLEPANIQYLAWLSYSLGAVCPQFEAWFDRLGGLWSTGWYDLPLEEVAA